jgi:sortase (surface protein transpeptidase)
MSDVGPTTTRGSPVAPPPNYPRQAHGFPYVGKRRYCEFPKRAAAAWVFAIVAFFGGGVLLATYAGVTPKATTPGAAALPAEPTQRPPPAGIKPLPRSVPVRLEISSINVHAPVGSLGTAADGTVEVPPLSRPNLTGWYRGSVTPGQTGNAVILGHVDSHSVGAAVFYHLGDLKPGDLVSVTRADRSVAIFRVYGVASFAKAKFPTALVYGPNTKPELRLVTCGGTYNPTRQEYVESVIAVATMVSSRPG